MNKFNFGFINDSNLALSTYGIAAKNMAGNYVVYNREKEEMINVDNLTFDAQNMIYSMPVAMKDVMIGDLILHCGHYCVVTDGDESVLSVIDLTDSSIKSIIPAKSPFGFNFITVIRSIIDPGKASADSPFGDNFMMMMLIRDGKLNKDMLPFLMMNKGGTMDPMMMTLLLSK